VATSIYVNNRVTSVPGVYSTIDATGLAQVGLSATGIVAVLGTAQNGVPYTAAGTDAGNLPRATYPQQLRQLFGSGDVLEAGMMLFDPSSDPNVLGGAQIVIPVQVNPAAAATFDLVATTGDSLKVSSKAHGPAANAITVTVATGSSSGVKLTVKNPSTNATEVYDNQTDLVALAAKVNQASQLISVVIPSGATAVPAVTSGAQNLTGGADNAAVQADWQAALDLLKQLRVNAIVALSSDAGVISAVQAHVDYMCGAGRSERNAFVGIANTDGTPPSLSTLKTAIQNIGDRNVQACVQSITRTDSNGVSRTFPSYFLGAIAAGMQAGAGLGQPLTFKFLKVLGLSQDPSWNPIDNADQLITAGALIAQRIDGIGIRWVRNVTTYLADNNLAFVEGSTNASVNFVAYTMRNTLEFAVGRPGFAGTQNAIKSVATTSLKLLVQAGIIANFFGVTVTPNNDVFAVSFSVAPALPINFIPITINLVSPQAAAAAA
jgi:hypothetical protein